MKQNLTFIRSRDVQEIYGISRTTTWRYVRQGKLPPPTKISEGICGWDRARLDEFFGIKSEVTKTE
ncbi:helix-turn-helix transcriptional regulator [Methylicorpusculum sp.]|uniref:helix-turn-helix transcriptional regulator n=1 Tax=Methylicorpusculum sp. TaxID=2713644 RepID=UPI0027273614|nr:helix-turn-helix domain-containing protein [Methylicorpusculum sp.]MDO8844471.1 AlpA family phage regulatory protein [Methylicorpusculum sp.]MDP2179080.1 AlpA family phage regulatory protein [Methylicorpusculum sp.]MDP3529450.1 AlpA family phage regulatory protein [Methylicorpusculum sp.]MDZ4150757.1 helix-turn-helix domain-containing protein [Methylicorpusculum sp.]